MTECKVRLTLTQSAWLKCHLCISSPALNWTDKPFVDANEILNIYLLTALPVSADFFLEEWGTGLAVDSVRSETFGSCAGETESVPVTCCALPQIILKFNGQDHWRQSGQDQEIHLFKSHPFSSLAVKSTSGPSVSLLIAVFFAW